MTIAEIRHRLGEYEAVRVDGTVASRAAVAIILRPSNVDAEVLLIRRATRDGDPWSGQMAFPGGRRSPADRDDIETAVREAHEEVGIDLAADGDLLGALDELHAVARNRPLELVIVPLVWVLTRRVEPVPCEAEVAGTVWVPLSFLRSPRAHAVYRRTIEDIVDEFPAYEYEGNTIWGLTHRILTGFLELIAD